MIRWVNQWLRLLALATLNVACGSRTEVEEDGDASLSQLDAVVPADATTVDSPFDASDDVSTDTEDVGADVGHVCPNDCTTNQDCKAMCPSLSTGRYCCDAPSGMCYAWAGKPCPDIVADARLD